MCLKMSDKQIQIRVRLRFGVADLFIKNLGLKRPQKTL